MKKYILILFIWMLKIYPVSFNAIMISVYYVYLSFGIDTSKWLYDITGASLYSLSICFLSSYVFKFCTWYRILCVSSLAAIISEWIDVNLVSIPHYAYFIQSILTVGLLTSLAVFNYERKFKKKNNRSLKKVN